MTDFNKFAEYIINNGSTVDSYTAVDNENNIVYAFEVNFKETIFLIIFDNQNNCTGILKK